MAAHRGADGRGLQESAITQGVESSAFVSAGSVDITPDWPLPLAGYPGRRRPSSGVADPLELNALLLRAPGQTVAILTADLLFVTAELKARLLQAVGARLGLDEASLLVGASHTHTAPALDPGKPRLGPCDPDYAALVTERAAELLGRLAAIDPVPCHVDYRTGAADHAINRRRPGWHVSLRHLPYRGVRRAPNPGGPRDETLHVLTFSDPTDRPIAVLWSYACHPVGFPARTRVSADFPGVVRRALRDAHGAELPVLFLQGFAGDVRPRETGATTRFTRRLAELVIGPVFAAFTPAQYAAWAGTLADRVVGVARGALRTRRPIAPVCRRERIALSALVAGATAGRDVTLQRVSPDPGLHLVAVSAEPVTAYGTALRRICPGAVLPIGCIDSVFGYLPTASMLGERGYEDSTFMEPFGLAGRFRPDVEGVVAGAWERLMR